MLLVKGIILTAGVAALAVAAVAQPFNVKFYGAASVGVGGTTTLDLTINNPNATDFTSVTGSDVLPADQVIATPNGLLSACTPGSALGTLTAVAGTNTVTIGASTIKSGGACTVQVNVTGVAPGSIPNTFVSSDAVAGAGNAATAVLNVLPIAPPTISKAFGTATMGIGATTSVTFTVTAAQALTNVNFTDTLPAGLVVSTPSGLASTCGGVAFAATGASTLSLTGGVFAAAGTCTVSANVTATSAGLKTNAVTVSDAMAGIGNTATATITVLAPATVSKTFASPVLYAYFGPFNTTTLTFTVGNPNASSLSGIGFTDILPAGMFVTGSPSGTCSGVTANVGSNVIAMSGGSLGGSSSCTFSVQVSADVADGTLTNMTSPISGGGTTGIGASASILSSDLYLLWFFS